MYSYSKENPTARARIHHFFSLRAVLQKQFYQLPSPLKCVKKHNHNMLIIQIIQPQRCTIKKGVKLNIKNMNKRNENTT